MGFRYYEKYSFTDENALAKIKLNNIVIQTVLTNKFIDTAPSYLLECFKSGLYIKYVKKNSPYKGRGISSFYKTPEDKKEAKKNHYIKYYISHKISKIGSSLEHPLPVIAKN